MPRRHLLITKDFPYHVTVRCNNKDWFYVPLKEAWGIFCRKLQETIGSFECNIYAFILMSNHLHAILSVKDPESNLGDVMRYFLTNSSKAILTKSKRINHVFGSRYKWSVLDSPFSVAYVLKYLYRNPIRAGICSKVEDYPFSSLIYRPKIIFPPTLESIEPLWSMVPKKTEDKIDWLNLPTPKEVEELIKKGLKRNIFKFSRQNTDQKKLRLLHQNYGIMAPEMTGTF